MIKLMDVRLRGHDSSRWTLESPWLTGKLPRVMSKSTVTGCNNLNGLPMIRRKFHIDRYSLVVQLVLSFLALILLTTTAVGLPAVLLIRNQVAHQTWARVNQGSRATEALYAAWQRRVSDLAFLTAQRPTLSLLLAQEQGETLSAYLQALQKDTELDVILVCDPEGRPIIQTTTAISAAMCDMEDASGLHIISSGACSASVDDGCPSYWQ